MADEGATCRKIEENVCKDRISALPEDLLLEILWFVPTKDAVSTALLSKRWRSIWKLVPGLVYSDTDNVWWFLNKSLQLHKAPVLENLTVSLGPTCPVDVDVGRFVIDAVDRCIEWLDFNLEWLAEPISLSKSLYTCKTLTRLFLSNKIFVDVSSQACLPSLQILKLDSVVYKDEDSLVRLISDCPVLKCLSVKRHKNDSLINFRVKARPSLQSLVYSNYYSKKDVGSLIIDSPGLKMVKIHDFSRDLCLIDNMPPCLDKARLFMLSHTNSIDMFLRFLSSAMYLDLTWITATVSSFDNPLSFSLLIKVDPSATYVASVSIRLQCAFGMNFSRLIECKLITLYAYLVDSLMLLLRNSPKLKVLMIHSGGYRSGDLPLSWNQPSSVPGCLSSHLEIFEWRAYNGRIVERQLLTYILSNSKCLKTVGISLRSTDHDEEKFMMDELKSISRVSESSQLLFSTQFRWRSMKDPDFY